MSAQQKRSASASSGDESLMIIDSPINPPNLWMDQKQEQIQRYQERNMDPLKLFKIQQGQKKQESGSSIKEDPQQPKSAESNKQMQFSPVK